MGGNGARSMSGMKRSRFGDWKTAEPERKAEQKSRSYSFSSVKSMVETIDKWIGVDLSHGETTRRWGGGVIVPNDSLSRNDRRDLESLAISTDAFEVQPWSGWQTLINRKRK